MRRAGSGLRKAAEQLRQVMDDNNLLSRKAASSYTARVSLYEASLNSIVCNQ